MRDDKKRGRITAIIKLIILLAIILGIPAALYLRFGSDLFSMSTVYWFTDYLRSHKAASSWILITAQIIQVIVCLLPGQPIQFAASYLFGIFHGLALSIAGAVIGTVISFSLARFLGRDFLYLFFDRDKIEEYYIKLNSGKALMIVLLIYLIPGVPKDLVSYAAGISEMKLRPFILVSTIGRCPGMAGSLLFGHFFGTGNYKAIAVLAVVCAAVLILLLIKRRDVIALLDKIETGEKEMETVNNG